MSNQFRIELTTVSESKVFWTLFSRCGDNWFNCGSGWAKDFLSSYNNAYNYYILYTKYNT